MTFPANAAETGCVPFDPSGAVCAASVPAHSLSQGDPDDLYKGFTFVTNTYPLADAEFDDNWTYLQRGGEASSINVSNIMVPSKIGATVKLPNAGTWTDAQGEEHELDATLTVTDTNGGLIGGYTNDGDGVQYLALSGLRGDHHDHIDPIGEKVSAAEPQPTDDSKRTGIEVKVSFTYAGTDTPVPDSFKGLTGFGDLDGTDGSPAGIEGVELIDGFDGLWLPDDDHLTAFDENGYGGSDECQEQLNLAARHAQQHMFTAAFSGPDFTVRYSQGASKSAYSAVFSAPLLADQLVYKVTARAVDENGNEIKAPWTVTDGLRVNGTYELTDIPAIDGYEYVGPAKDSAPLRGKRHQQRRKRRPDNHPYVQAARHHQLQRQRRQGNRCGRDRGRWHRRGYETQRVHASRLHVHRLEHETGWDGHPVPAGRGHPPRRGCDLVRHVGGESGEYPVRPECEEHDR